MTAHEKKQTYWFLFAIIFIVSLGFALIHPFLSIYLKNLNISGFEIGSIYTAYALAKMVSAPVIGKWSDGGNRRRFIRIGLELCVLVSLGFLFIPAGLAVLIFLRIIEGIGISMIRPLALAFVGDISENRARGKTMGTFDLSFYAALALGPVLGGVINDTFGYQGIFISLTTLLGLALILSILGRPFRGQNAIPRPISSVNITDLFRSQMMLGLYCFIFARSFGIVMVAVFLPLFMHTELRFSLLQIGWIIGIGSVINLVLLVPCGKLADRFNRSMLVFLGAISTGFAIILIPFQTAFWQMAILYAVISLAGTISLPASSALLASEGVSHGMGLTFGVFNTVMNAGFLVAPLIGGLLMDCWGLHFIFPLTGGLGIVGGIFFIVLANLGSRFRRSPCFFSAQPPCESLKW